MEYQICRTCLERGTDFINLFNHIINGKTLSEMLADCIQIEVTKDEDFPYHICDECTGKLTSLWTFKELVLESEEKLRREYVTKKTYIAMVVKEEPSEIQINTVNESKMTLIYNSIQSEQNCFTVEDPIISKIFEESILSCQENKEISTDSTAVKTENQTKNKLTNNLTEIMPDKKLQIEALQIPYYKSNASIEPEALNSSQHSDHFTIYTESDTCNNNKNNSISNEDVDGKPKSKVHCKECNKMVSHDYYYRVHIHFHTGGRFFECKVCDKSFINDYQLIKHKAEHKSQPHTCYICGKSFKTFPTLRYHRSTHKNVPGIERNQKQCEICKKVFKTAKTLYYHHKIVHIMKRSYICTICNKGFKKENILTQHMLRHKEERIYTCEFCGKSCPTIGNLITHKSIHKTERIIPCSTCGKRFSSNIKLRRHLVCHIEDKAFTCDYCGKAFKTSFAKKRHILIHTGEKPYSCKICGKKFADTGTLSRHMLTHTGETRYSCDKCMYKCKYKQQFDNHRKKHKQQ